jgi:hypothetical protein
MKNYTDKVHFVFGLNISLPLFVKKIYLLLLQFLFLG